MTDETRRSPAETVSHAAPVRIQRMRTPGWRMPANTVSVTRPGKWGNPFKIAPAFECEGVKFPEITAESAVTLYRKWLERALQNWPSTSDALVALHGKNLACWCKLGAPCHADVLLDLANPEQLTAYQRPEDSDA